MSSACHPTIPLPAEQKSVLNTPSAIDSRVRNFETENRLERFFWLDQKLGHVEKVPGQIE